MTLTRPNWLLGVAAGGALAVALTYRFWVQESHQEVTRRPAATASVPIVDHGPASEQAERLPLPAAVGQDEVGLTFEAPPPVFDQAQALTTLPPSTHDLPGNAFAPREYQRTSMQIFRDFWNQALAWTAADYRDHADHAEALNGREAYQVYAYLRTCLDQPRTEAAVERKISRYRQGKRWRDAMVQRDVDALIRCEGLDQLGDLNLLALEWLTMAAERGFPQAQVAYYKSPRWLIRRSRDAIFRYPELAYQYRDRAHMFLNAALRSGHPDALLEYADALLDGIVVAADPEAAYAYAYAADLAAGGGHSEARRKLAALSAELPLNKRHQAESLGRDLCAQFCDSGGSR